MIATLGHLVSGLVVYPRFGSARLRFRVEVCGARRLPRFRHCNTACPSLG